VSTGFVSGGDFPKKGKARLNESGSMMFCILAMPLLLRAQEVKQRLPINIRHHLLAVPGAGRHIER
jgi:hypothetical protein